MLIEIIEDNTTMRGENFFIWELFLEVFEQFLFEEAAIFAF